MRAGFACEHILTRWKPPSGAVEMATVTSVSVLLFKMRCVFFFSLQEFVCSLRTKLLLFFPFCQKIGSANPFLWRPRMLCMPCPDRLFLYGKKTLPFHFGRYGLFSGWQRQQQTNRPTDLAGG